MIRDEIEITLRLLTGLWPMPQMQEDEAAVWTRTLWAMDYDVTGDVLELLAASGLHQFRPNAGQVIAAYRTEVKRREMNQRPAEIEGTMTPEVGKAWLAKIKAERMKAPAP